MLGKILIANRGEIAVRIIRACKELNIKTVAIFSEADREALHTKMADEAYCVGPAPSKDSYLHIENILNIALLSNVDGIHPGYGFLAENAEFAALCEEAGIVFIGPLPDSIRRMGIKDIARQTMKDAGVPIVPGSDGITNDFEEGIKIAEEIGFPVIIKATAGGGGKGIRVARDAESLRKGLEITQQEAATAFGNPGVYLEKFIEDFRHVEIQILADKFGNVIHLGERDCTIQRRMQKLIEETPSPALSAGTRAKMGEAAIQASKAVNYVGAGTVEFIYDYKNDLFYFMEMNTRIQVEHTITEMVTGVDLVQEQLRIASGFPLLLQQEDITLSGCSIECRINAENPANNFMPSPGKITEYMPPGGLGVRVDSSVYTGYTIQPFYDSMVAKLIVHGKTRDEAIRKMKRALDEFSVEGVHTTIPFHQSLLENEIFTSGDFNTNFLETYNMKQPG
ncbi:acetyl-CoA carboxylase biotin carboxylase subunit [Bacillus sp. S/N-304-OC-R1]|uniref:acetyl-CoA carboxylase biotin carboxylase subunit n=1 Tax=Bacillus sp. S/N-304-OC-R1 TaxID=2758034 RepID=UPI001C8D47B1|nr:acetyl-CoA carboxylase biotin carboxylase subunit [Bacillus sp. S/N-304-OC-R1]MBY0123208.1 acetyl-CoA carboxylase biotin carboxylase subunit [Bacillus sp. S/N-304-OC-R1]